MDRLSEQTVSRLYQLELPNKILYRIKVSRSYLQRNEQKLYYKIKKYNAVWVLFATCQEGEDPESIIRVHFGSKGKLTPL